MLGHWVVRWRLMETIKYYNSHNIPAVSVNEKFLIFIKQTNLENGR